MAVSSPWGLSFAPPITQSTSSHLSSDCFPKKSGLNFRPFAFPRRLSRSKNGVSRDSTSFLCRCSLTRGDGEADSPASCAPGVAVDGRDWDWNQWMRHFSEVEQAESYASVLKFQLEEAIEEEDFEEASKLKSAIAEATSKDAVAEIMSELKRAIDEERYHDASKLSKATGSGLVGWWVGYSKDSDDPFGRIVHITPGIGRFTGKSYSPRQLVSGSPGTPLFEIYVVKDTNGIYSVKVVFLYRSKGNPSTNALLQPKPIRKESSSETESEPVVDSQSHDDKVEKQEEKGLTIEETAEGIKSVLNFLKDKIPGLKFKLMDVDVLDVDISEESESLKQIIQEEDEETDEDSEDESNSGDLQSEGEVLEDNGDLMGNEKELGVNVIIGGVLHNNDDAPPKNEFARFPAEIKDVGKDSFLLHAPGIPESSGESKPPNVKVSTVVSQGASDLMPPDVAKIFMGSGSSKVSQDVREIVKLAVSQAQKRNTLSEYTTFNRLIISKGNLDPFEGLYVGSFGPYGTEVVQLRRKFGHWNGGGSSLKKSNDVEFFEYVEAVKLTGDLNVPAGQVTFRAKIGRGSRVSNHGMYPDELGVVGSYKGQGQIAEFGFRNPRWVDGELLQLNGKGIGPYARGADLGFLYVVPEQSFLVLFNRLNLPG